MRPDQRKQQQKTNRCISTVIKPLRILEFFAVLLLFVFTVYMAAMEPTPFNGLICILLIVLSGVYVLFLTVELISYFGGRTLHILPMFAFSLFGVLLFGIAGTLLIFGAYTRIAVEIVAVTVCLLAALLFLIDITMVLVFWKRRCSVCKRCCDNDITQHPYRIYEKLHAVDAELTKRDVTTSLSDVRLHPEREDVATPDHSYRKIQHPQRRQYVDCPTCTPSLCNLEVAQIQTEPKTVSVVDIQTPRTITKETPMQTSSKCDFCQRQMQPFATSVNDNTATSLAHHLSQWTTCPAILQVVRGGISVPCCPGCKCVTGATKQQLPSTERSKRPTVSPNRALTSETTQQVASPTSTTDGDVTAGLTRTEVSTRHTPAHLKSTSGTPSTAPNKRDGRTFEGGNIENVSREDKIDAVDGGTVSQSARVKAEETSATSEKDYGVCKRYSAKERESSEDECSLEIENAKDVAKRIKGGGENRADMLGPFLRMTKTDVSSKPAIATQVSATLITRSAARTKPRTFLPLRSNKVDPVDETDVSEERRVGGSAESEASRVPTTQEVDPVESANPVEDQTNDFCRLCKRQKATVSTPDSPRHYAVFQNKRGKYFCEFCAPLDSMKVTSGLDVRDLKRLRCTNCKFSLRGRIVGAVSIDGLNEGKNVLLKPDACPKCGQSRRSPPTSV